VAATIRLLGRLVSGPPRVSTPRTTIRDLFHRHAKPSQLEQALQRLLTEGFAIRTPEETGGRPAIRWRALRP